MTLDGVVIPDSMFTPAGGGFEVARVPLPDCAPSLQVCTHRLHGLHGMTMRGMDIASSYALTAPAWGNCLIGSMIPAPAERALWSLPRRGACATNVSAAALPPPRGSG